MEKVGDWIDHHCCSTLLVKMPEPFAFMQTGAKSTWAIFPAAPCLEARWRFTIAPKSAKLLGFFRLIITLFFNYHPSFDSQQRMYRGILGLLLLSSLLCWNDSFFHDLGQAV